VDVTARALDSEEMAKTWVLDTETKGTGAQMVPLEKVLRKGGPEPELNLVELGREVTRDAEPEPQAPEPLRFKIVDLMTRETLAQDADARATVEALGRVRSIVDVRIFVWSPERDDWRVLTLDERRALWDFRRANAGAEAPR
jgi:hypothetical protein